VEIEPKVGIDRAAMLLQIRATGLGFPLNRAGFGMRRSPPNVSPAYHEADGNALSGQAE
jgi:hypothetical protein